MIMCQVSGNVCQEAEKTYQLPFADPADMSDVLNDIPRTFSSIVCPHSQISDATSIFSVNL